mgnify:CR=1 FL=1
MSRFVTVPNGDYKIKVQSGGEITLDTGVTTGAVRVTGDLIIEGTRTQVTSNELSVKDNIIISIDHEGGRIQRLLKEFTHLPSLEAISNIKNYELRKKIANQSGYVSGYELSEMNIKENTIGLMSIPGGAFELPLATKKLIEKTKPKVVIVVGCIISPDGAGTTPRSL